MKYISVSNFSKKLGVSRQFTWIHIRDGRIKAVKVGKLYKIPESEIKRIEEGKW